MNANVNKNTVSPIASTIASIMSDAASSNNKQASLVVALFDSEVTFANEILLGMLKKEKAERTQARENLIRSISDDYANALDTIAVLKDKGKKDRSEKEAFQMETLNAKVRAANIMFERAAISVVSMRHTNVKKVKASAIGAGALEIFQEETDGDEKYTVKHKMSCASLLSGAQKVVDKLTGKTKKEESAPNPAKAGMVQTIETVSRYIDVTLKDETAPVHSIADYADATEQALETLLAKLFFLKFGTGKDVNMKDVAAYAAELGKRPITPAVGNGNGAAKPAGNGAPAQKKTVNA